MKLNLYNTLTGKVENVQPSDKNIFRMYSCGPTVYDVPHIGNFRAFLFFDFVKRYLQFLGYKVIHVMNITDVDDKIIARCIESGEKLEELTSRFANCFKEDAKTLSIDLPDFLPKATNHIPEMINLVRSLIEKGNAYQTEDGSVFFKIKSFSDYGKLSKIAMDQIASTDRVAEDEYDKENPQDFALWKGWKDTDGDIGWDSPWGRGRPGWHIECSAMSMKYLGLEFDIHCGGVDLVFPHHENEIAQSICATGQSFAKTWLHCEHLLVNGAKMSKSLENFYTLQDVIDKGYSSQSIRYLLISSHYRQKVDLTEDNLHSAQQAVKRLRDFRRRLLNIAHKDSVQSQKPSVLTQFISSMNNDLNVAEALGILFEWVREINIKIDSKKISETEAASCLYTINKIDSLLCIQDDFAIEISPKEWSLIKERELARENKNWARSDEIREYFQEKGIELEDTPDGTNVKS